MILTLRRRALSVAGALALLLGLGLALPAAAQVSIGSPEQAQFPVPIIVQKATNNVGGATVKTVSTTITSTTKGNTLIVTVCAGEVVGANIVLTISDTQSDTFVLDGTQAQSTTFACSIYRAQNIAAANTTVTATFSGSSSANTTLAEEVYEINVPPAFATEFVLDQIATGNATSTAPSAGPAGAEVPNELAFGVFGVGTAAQTITVTGTGTFSNDSGQVNPTSASGLFSFVSVSQSFADPQVVYAQGTMTSDPWVAVEATYKYAGSVVDHTICPYNYVGNANSSSGSTQFAAAVTGKSVYICAAYYTGAATTVNTLKLQYGTGSNCATGTTDLTIAAAILATSTASPAGIVQTIPPNSFVATPPGQAACINLSAAQSINAEVLWGYR